MPEVGGSRPSSPTNFELEKETSTNFSRRNSAEQSAAFRPRWTGVRIPPAAPQNAGVAQSEERRRATPEAAGSKPAVRSRYQNRWGLAQPAARRALTPEVQVRPLGPQPHHTERRKREG